MDIKDIIRDIDKEQFAPVYFFYGEEDYLIDMLVKYIISKGIEPETKDFNIDILSGAQTDGETVVNIASSFPMMAPRRIVIVKSIQKCTPSDKKRILEYVQSPLESTCLIMTANKIDRRQSFYAAVTKKCRWVECARLYENQAVDWVKQHLRKKNITIKSEAADFLVQQVGTSLWTLYQELEKLQTFAWGDKNIGLDQVAAVVGSSRKFNTWELTDSVARKDIQAAFTLMKRLLETGQSPIGMIMDITRRILLLMRLRAILDGGMNEQEAVRMLKFRPFFARIYLNQVAKFTYSELERILQILLRADISIKTGYMKPNLVMTLLIYDLTHGISGKRFFKV